MFPPKITIPITIILSIVLIVTFPAFAENRWIVGLKSGAGAGTLGLEVEKEWSGFSILAQAGYVSESATAGGILLRWYFSKRKVNRVFIETIGAVVAVEMESSYFYEGGVVEVPLVGVAGGYDWRLGTLRIGVEGGIAWALIIPLPLFGLSVGYCF